jgi:putative heme-binding domain-containing protein
VRLKALAALARPGQPLAPEAFALLTAISREPTSSPARIEAARILATSRLSRPQLEVLTSIYAETGPVELRQLVKIVRRSPAELAPAFATSLAKSPVLGSIEESVIKTNFSNAPAQVYESILAPAIREADAANEAKKQSLEALAVAARRGRPAEGRKVFESGKGACIACHQVGDKGQSIGPNLSHIGQIRRERDLLESILFPDATLARDYETHVIETSDGERLMGMIRSQGEETLRLVDLAGQEKAVPHARIVASSALTTSLMPSGLEKTMSEQELLDLVAWLVSMK